MSMILLWSEYTWKLARSVRDRWREELPYAHVFAQSPPIIRRVCRGLFVNLVFVSRASRATWCNRQRHFFNVEMLKRLKRRIPRLRPDIEDVWKLCHENAPYTHCLLRDLLPDRFKGASSCPAALQSWRDSPRLLVPAVENSHERTSFWVGC